jgi:hypothetical protein
MHDPMTIQPATIAWSIEHINAAESARSFCSGAMSNADPIREQLGSLPALLEPGLVSANSYGVRIELWVRALDLIVENVNVIQSRGRFYLNPYRFDGYRIQPAQMISSLEQITEAVAHVAGFRQTERVDTPTQAEQIGRAIYFSELLLSQLCSFEQEAERVLEAIDRAGLV